MDIKDVPIVMWYSLIFQGIGLGARVYGESTKRFETLDGFPTKYGTPLAREEMPLELEALAPSIFGI